MKVEEIQLNSEDIIGNLDPEKLEKVAFILKTIAHPMRISVVGLLSVNDKLCVNDICERLGSEQSLTSHHLQNMRLKGLLKVKREGRSMMYSLKEKDISLIVECLENCQCNM